jgi:hypothetical protein
MRTEKYVLQCLLAITVIAALLPAPAMADGAVILSDPEL